MQAMLKVIAEDHDAKFEVVPKEFASDNGAMIAWTGILAFINGVRTPIEKSYVDPRWRLDEVEIPWR